MGIAVSPEGANVYVASRQSDAVAIYTRNAGGLLTYAGCIENTGSSLPCATSSDGLSGPRDVAVSPDGSNVYVSAFAPGSDTFRTLDRGPGGALTAGVHPCFNGVSGGPGGCWSIGGFDDPRGIGLSTDGGSLYVADSATPGGITRFTRAANGGLAFGGTYSSPAILSSPFRVSVSPDGETVYTAGTLTGNIVWIPRNPDGSLALGSADCIVDALAAGCGGKSAEGLAAARGVAVSPDGENVYVTSPTEDAVVTFNRSAGGTLISAGCVMDPGSTAVCGSTLPGLDGAANLVVSPDGENLYVASQDSDSVSAFSRGADGVLTAINCVQNSGGTACGNTAPGLDMPAGLALSPDGLNLYATSFNSDAVAWFGRNRTPACTGASASTAAGTPVTVSLSCTDANGDSLTRSVVMAPGYGSVGPVDQPLGSVTYTPNAGFAGTDSFTFTGSDGGASATPVTATISVNASSTTTPVSLTGLKVVPKRFRRGSRLPKMAKRVRTGAKIRFKLSEEATVKLSFKRKLRGRRVGKKCRRPTKRLSKRKRCTRLVGKGSFKIGGLAGQNKVRFEGHLKSKHRLPVGRYLLTAKPTSSASVKGKAKSTSFALLRSAHRKR